MIDPFELVFSNILFFYPEFRSTDTARRNYGQLIQTVDRAVRDGSLGTRGLLVYLHIPYCVRICRFCGYHRKRLANPQVLSAYVDRLLAEIRDWSAILDGPRQNVSNIYLGGGTPTLLSLSDLNRIVDALKASFRISDETEFDLESDMASLQDAAKLNGYRAAGVKRISFGLQSLDREVRKKAAILDPGETDLLAQCCERLRDAGYGVNCDLMFGLPGQSAESFLQDIRAAAADFAVDHLDLLEFFPQPESYIARKFSEFEKLIADRDTRRIMYVGARRYLLEHGFMQQTLSDFWRQGVRPSSFKARLYRNADILGLGANAHGVLGGCAYRNARLDEGYMDEPPGALPLAFIRPLSPSLLRTRSLALLPKLLTFSVGDFPEGLTDKEHALLRRFQKAGCLDRGEDTFSVTETGMLNSAEMMLETLRAASA